MALQAGTVHLAQWYVKVHSTPKSPTPPPKKKSPEQVVVQQKLEEQRQLQSPRSCLKGRSVTPISSGSSGETTPNGKKVAFTLPAGKTPKDKGDITTLDLSTEENLEGIIYPSCMNWTIETHLDKGKEETIPIVAWKAFQWTISNYSSIPKVKDSEHVNGILSRLFVTGQNSPDCQQETLIEIAKQLLEDPDLVDIFEGVLLAINDEHRHSILEIARDKKNLNALNVFVHLQVNMEDLAWEEVADECLKVTPSHSLFKNIAKFLAPSRQLELLDQFLTQKQWDNITTLFQCIPFVGALKESNQGGEYDEKLRAIAEFAAEDSQYLALLQSVLNLIKSEHYMALADIARKHGNRDAEGLLVRSLPVARPNTPRAIFSFTNIR